jgi:hypothetical protein
MMATVVMGGRQISQIRGLAWIARQGRGAFDCPITMQRMARHIARKSRSVKSAPGWFVEAGLRRNSSFRWQGRLAISANFISGHSSGPIFLISSHLARDGS